MVSQCVISGNQAGTWGGGVVLFETASTVVNCVIGGNDALIGQHALGYSVLAFLALAVHRRIQWFPPWQQALHLLLMMLLTQALTLTIRIISGASFPGWTYFAGSFICAALWPVLSFLLLLPQRQAEMKDDNRPI